jgi:hypothetical protein
MTLGPLRVHFADETQADALRGDASLRVVTLPGQPAEREALFTALAEALALPGYFGRNWDALADCLSDLPPTVLLVPAALWETSPELAAMLAEIWMSAGEGQHLVFLRRDA